MSMRAIEWVWRLKLQILSKMILLALADIADDSGYCWPRVQLIAQRCGCSARTVRRHTARFVERGLISVEHRYRKDGSQTSNGYRLALDGPSDRLPDGGDGNDHGGGPATSQLGDTNVSPLTTTDPPVIQKPQSSTLADLEYPASFTFSQIHEAQRVVASAGEDAQAILDVLSAAYETRTIRNGIFYLKKLVARYHSGGFDPAPGKVIAERRRKHRPNQMASVSISERPWPADLPKTECAKMTSADGLRELKRITRALLVRK